MEKKKKVLVTPTFRIAKENPKTQSQMSKTTSFFYPKKNLPNNSNNRSKIMRKSFGKTANLKNNIFINSVQSKQINDESLKNVIIQNNNEISKENNNINNINFEKYQIDYLSSQLEAFIHTSNLNAVNNLIMSPISLYLSLGLAANGAVGQTQTEILNFLKADSIEKLNDFSQNIVNQIKSLINCDLANIVLSKFKIKQNFINISKNIFNSKVDLLTNIAQVNKWASDHTNGRIPIIIDKVLSEPLILLNAVYFEGKWKKPFRRLNTTLLPFYSPNGVKKCNMMNNSKLNAFYKETEEYQVIRLYYTNETNALIILPREDILIDDFVRGLNKEKWKNIVENMSIEKVDFSLPRFKIETKDTDLFQPLINLGLKAPFECTADFSNLVENPPIFIKKIAQRAFLKVDEKGTEAAVVTKIQFGCTASAPKLDHYIMKVDRPFLFVIRSNAQRETFLLFAKIVSV